MKSFRLGIALLSAGLMAYSPVTVASMDIARKNTINRNTKYSATGTWNDFYNIHGNTLSPEVRGNFEAWLQTFGKQKISKPQVQIIKDKNGKESLQLIMNQAGKALTVVFTEGNNESFTANGVQIQFSELNHMSTVIERLAEKDSSLKPLTKALRTETAPTRNWNKVNARHIAAVTPLQRVEFFALMRGSVEAAQKVLEAGNKGKKTSFFLHPLISEQLAWAANVNVNGKRCMVAGNLSIYENNRCQPFPQDAGQFSPLPAMHSACENNSRGNMVACNPIIYGLNKESGAPHCVASDNQPRFTERATADCGNKSPLDPDPNSPNRPAQYRRILESYAHSKAIKNGQGQDLGKISACFNSENKVKKDEFCSQLFESHLAEFNAFKKDAATVCAPDNLSQLLGDQKFACSEFEKRELALAYYLENTMLKGLEPVTVVGQPVPQVIAGEENCKAAGGSMNKDTLQCICDGGRIARPVGDGGFSCDTEVIITPVTPEKDKCTKEDGSKSNSIKCNPMLWLLGGLGVLAAIWLCKNSDPQNPPQKPCTGPLCNVGPNIPPGTPTTLPTLPPVITPTTQPPTVTTQPPVVIPSEQGAGTNNGTSGGVRPGAK